MSIETLRWATLASLAASCLTASLAFAAERQAELVSNTTLEAPAAEGAAFGGLSGLDYDPKTDSWLLLSDDRYDVAPSRFWDAKIAFGKNDPKVTLGARQTLKSSNGQPYGKHAVDPESIRRDPCGKSLFWSSEQTANGVPTPMLRRMSASGIDEGQVPLPSAWAHTATSGGQDNNGLEGFTFDVACGSLWLALEGPLKQDGDKPQGDQRALTRITQVDREGRVLKQIAYRLDAIKVAPGETPIDTGVSEILMLDARRLLVLERSGVKKANGDWRSHCRLYWVDLATAPDVQHVASFLAETPLEAEKHTILDFDDLTPEVDVNLEGMAWGPLEADGAPLLVLVSDNNFKAMTPTKLAVLRLDRDLVCAAPTAKCASAPGAPTP